MRTGLERNEFCLYYQPVVRLETGALIGFEALIRWRHPERGLIVPAEFIHIVEGNDLILELCEWAVDKACGQLREWQKINYLAAGLTMSVNLSRKEFRLHDLTNRVARALGSTGQAPEYLKLEITESHIIENSKFAETVINRLHNLGIEFSIEDFGTGYSSLSYLHRLPFSYLKIDRSFVTLMNENAENYETLRTIIKLAQSLKMKVVADGIETSEHVYGLRQLQCDFGQGGFVSKPLDSANAKRFIEEQLSDYVPAAHDPVRDMKLSIY